MKKLHLLFLSVFGFLSNYCHASLIEIADGQFATVSNAVSSASAGDLIRITTTGDWSWTNQLTITKRIQIEGASTNVGRTVIRCGGTQSTYLILFSAVSIANTNLGPFGVSYITFYPGDHQANGVVGLGGNTQTNVLFRFHHLNIMMTHENPSSMKGMSVVGKVHGVVDHVLFKCPLTADKNVQGLRIIGFQRSRGIDYPGTSNPTDIGYNDTNTVKFGVDRFYGLSVEDCFFDFENDQDGTLDHYQDAESRIRHNVARNSNFFSAHEFGFIRSAVNAEFYDNYLVNDGGINNSATNFTILGTMRSGLGTYFGNVVSNLTGTAVTTNFFVRHYRATGTNVFGLWPSGYYSHMSVTGTNLLDGNINTNASEFGYPAMDQIGWSDPTIWTATNCIQTRYGSYQWSNTFNGLPMTFGYRETQEQVDAIHALPAANGNPSPASSDLIKLGRDIFDATERPNYTPWPYPDPIVANDTTPTPPIDATVSITSAGATGVFITTTVDVNGVSEGETPFAVDYVEGASLTLVAPPAAGGKVFTAWKRDGTQFSTNQTITTTADQRTFEAVYTTGETTVWSITITSTKPEAGVTITTTADDFDVTSVSTPGDVFYDDGASFTLTAPAYFGARRFRSWMKDGEFLSASRSITETASADSEYTAVYSDAAALSGKLTVSGNVAFQ